MSLRKHCWALFRCCLLLTLGGASLANASAQMSESAARQIAALAADKATWTEAQRKIDSQLLYAIKTKRGEAFTKTLPALNVNVGENQGRVVVDIIGTISPALLDRLQTNGAQVIISTPALHAMRVEIALDKLETIAAHPDVRSIVPERKKLNNSGERRLPGPVRPERARAARLQTVQERLTEILTPQIWQGPLTSALGTSIGAVESEGDLTHRAKTARGVFNTDGTLIKVGVLSDGVVNLASAQASGDLPPDVVVLPGQTGSGDEGTAMLEIIHDLAPGAKLYFATADPTPENFADNIQKLRDAGCDIIVDDVFYFVESPFQDGQGPLVMSTENSGIITQAVNNVTASGALYFSSAGNQGNVNDSTASVWEGDFVNGGTLAVIGGAAAGPVHDFDSSAGTSQYDQITVESDSPIVLYWSDPLGGSGNDYDLYVLNSAGTAVVAASTDSQTGTEDPVELVDGAANVTNNRIVVAKFAGADRYLHVNAFGGEMQFVTPGQTHGHSSAANAFSVAATPAYLPFGAPPNPTGPYPNPFNSSNRTELFSSDGPRRLFYSADGTPFTPGNVSSTGGIVRQKPDITAADGTSVTGAGGFPSPFYGTSAAAPHAGAIAALIKAARPTLTSAQIRTALTSSAIDIEAAGVDRDTGAGIVMAYQSLQAAGITATANLTIGTVAADDTGGNNNGFVEPGEQGTLTVQLTNPDGGATATGISATLSTNTPGVIVTSSTSTYPDIPPNGSASNNTPFAFTISGSVACPSTINFTLTVTYTGGGSPRTLTFEQPIGQSFSVNETLDAAAPTGGTTGSQIGRLARTGNPARCETTKANPGLNGTDSTQPHRYDAYTFENTTTSSICVTITLTTSAILQSAAYAPAFVPAQPDQNYLGDIGLSGPQTRTYSVNVPAGTTFDVVVNEVTATIMNPPSLAYTLSVTGLPCSATAANQPPVNTVPGPQNVAQNGQLVFSGTNGNQISIADPDAGSAPVQVTLTATNGTISLSGTSGLSFNTGDGADDSSTTFTGSITDINAALNGATFKPTTGFTGSATLSISTNDQGFTGSGGAGTDTDSISITVNAAGTLAFSSASYSIAENGGSATITVNRSGGSAGAVQVQYATSNGSATAGSDYTATSGTLNFANGVTSQSFTVPITNDTTPEGSESVLLTLSNPTGAGSLGNPSSAILTITDDDPAPGPTPRSLNISTRGMVMTGDRVLIAGSIITGNPSKRLLIRAIGPSLPSNIGNVLQDPVLELRGSSGQLIFSNDNWRDNQQTEIQATGMAPADDRDAAIVALLPAGSFTAIVRGKNNTTGVALAEIYDLDTGPGSELANISTRGFVQDGDQVMIGGFILGAGSGTSSVIVRALGPSLPASVGTRLSDPILELRNPNGALVRSNDNWQDDATQAAAISASGLAPTNPNESAIAETLPNGAYTAIVMGKNNSTGIGLVEIFNR